MSYTAVSKYPNMKSTVFDLPEVVRVADHFKPSLSECPNRDNVTFVAGDFFKMICLQQICTACAV